MDELVISAEPRDKTGKGVGRKLRTQGLIPAVLYGDNKPAVNLTLNGKEVEHILHRIGDESVILTVKIKGEKGAEKIFIKDVQRDVATDRLIHADLYRVSMKKKMRLETAVHPVGTANGVKMGGILEQVTRTIEIRCLPGDAPKYIEVDVSELEINRSIHVKDLSLSEEIEILADPETVLFTVLQPRIEEEVPVAEEVPAEEVAEPELVKKPGEEEAEEKEKEAEQKE